MQASMPPTTPDGPIVLLEGIHADADASLAATRMPIERLENTSNEAIAERLAVASVLGIRSRTQINESMLDSAPNLCAIGCFCIGTNQVDLRAAAKRGIPVFNAPFSNTRSVAELTLAEIIMLTRRIPQRNADMHAGRWHKSATGAREVRGRTLGIIGYGHIGSQLSILAESLGMQVVFHDIVPKLPLGTARAMPSLNALLAESDIVSLHVPATPLTNLMFGAEQIAHMKPGAIVINNARGNVVDLDALHAAISDERIGGAAIDVFPEEPDSREAGFQSALAGLPNVLLTPHIGGNTLEAQASIAGEVGNKIAHFLAEGGTGTAVNVPAVDLPLRKEGQHRLLHFHENVPGVLSKMHGVLAELGANINAEYLQSSGELSYVILDVDPIEVERVRERLAALPETIRVRSIA